MSIIVTLRLHVNQNSIQLVLHRLHHHRIDVHLRKRVQILDRHLNNPHRLIHILAKHVQIDATQPALHDIRRDVGQHLCGLFRMVCLLFGLLYLNLISKIKFSLFLDIFSTNLKFVSINKIQFLYLTCLYSFTNGLVFLDPALFPMTFVRHFDDEPLSILLNILTPLHPTLLPVTFRCRLMDKDLTFIHLRIHFIS